MELHKHPVNTQAVSEFRGFNVDAYSNSDLANFYSDDVIVTLTSAAKMATFV